MRKQTQKRFVDQTTYVDSFKEFSQKSMATIAGWIIATTAGLALDELFKEVIDDLVVVDVVSRAVYALIILVTVPLVDWRLRNYLTCEQGSFLADQVRLVKICQPMFAAWAWKDLVESLLSYSGNTFLSTSVAALVITSIVIAGQVTPCFKWAPRNISSGGNSLVAKMLYNLSNLGLAVGYAWNSVFAYAPTELMKEVKAPMFAFMIQVPYYFVITALIVYIIAKASGSEDAAAAVAIADSKTKLEEQLQNHMREGVTTIEIAEELVVNFVTDVTDDLSDAGKDVILNALHFVYAWAQFDTIEALYFTYLLGCEVPTSCSYQSNFAFALATAVIFGRSRPS